MLVLVKLVEDNVVGEEDDMMTILAAIIMRCPCEYDDRGFQKNEGFDPGFVKSDSEKS